MLSKQTKRVRRHNRLLKRIREQEGKARLFVFRSLKHIYGQIIDQRTGNILLTVSDLNITLSKKPKKTIAKEVGKMIAQQALEKKISSVVFDRAGYKYHGRVKEFADGAREAGLQF